MPFVNLVISVLYKSELVVAEDGYPFSINVLWVPGNMCDSYELSLLYRKFINSLHESIREKFQGGIQQPA
jgi:hypothetical protein